MNNLWAPWRINYILNKKPKGCVFCLMLGRKKSDKKNFVFIRSDCCFAVLNLYPYNNGHSMVVTNRHIKDLEDLKEEEIIDIFRILKITKKLLSKILKPQAYNIGVNLGEAAGAGIADHLHIHLVPRWNADTNFMPITSGTKVILQSLADLHKRLCQAQKKAKV